MKKVVIRVEPSTVSIENMDPRKFYAYWDKRAKVFIYCGDEYGFSPLNYDMARSYLRKTAEESMARALESQTVYEFDTQKELAQWIVEQE